LLRIEDIDMKPLIHFAHANGIPSAVYEKMFAALRDDAHGQSFDVVMLPLLGTDPRFPVDNHWNNLRDQVIDSIQRQAIDANGNPRPVIALGHSLGGLCSFLAAYEKPELMRGLVMLDPPMITGMYSFMMHLAKTFTPKAYDKRTPAALSSKRRDHWDSREQAADKLRGRGLFSSFDQDCFNAYIQHGLKDAPDGGVTLTIPKAVEVAIFQTNPSLFWLTPFRAPKIPVHLIAGRESLFYQRGFPQRLQKRMGIPYSVSEGGHMFPLERPIETAEMIKAVIKGFGV
jgi:pimeloyl-ACP methyl ester carboxylesterase